MTLDQLALLGILVKLARLAPPVPLAGLGRLEPLGIVDILVLRAELGTQVILVRLVILVIQAGLVL